MGNPPSTMKVLLFSSVFVALAGADTCSDCTAVVNAIQARLMSEESIAAQQAILVGGLCPGTDDPAECEANLPGFWAQIAALLWPGYWDPNVTCDSCQMGIQAGIDQLLAPETLDTIVDFLANGDFCAQNGDERCPAAVDGVIRQGLPMIAAAGADAGYAEACNNAVEGTCPASLF